MTSLASAAEAGRKDRVLAGIALMLGSTMLLSLSNLLGKILIARYPIGEVMFLRSSGALLLCGALVLPGAGLAVFGTSRPRAHVARGLSQAISQTLTVAALALLPLASVTAIGFSAPLFTAVLAILFFNEKSDLIRGGVLAVGFCGVLLVTHPGSNTLQLGALLALGNAVMYGSVTIAVRRMTKTEGAGTLLMWQMGVMTVAHAGLLVLGFRCPVGADWPLFALLGTSNAGAQFLWTRALAAAPATVVSPLYYSMLIWGAGLGFIVFGEVPSGWVVAGGLVVAASGIVLVLHEARRLPVRPLRFPGAWRDHAASASLPSQSATRSGILAAGTARL